MSEQMIQSEIEAAEQAGSTALLYIRKGIGRPKDAGDLARFAARFACRAMYWQSGQERKDSIEHMVLTQNRFGVKQGPPVFFGRTEQQIAWEKEDREYFTRKQWDWFNGTSRSAP